MHLLIEELRSTEAFAVREAQTEVLRGIEAYVCSGAEDEERVNALLPTLRQTNIVEAAPKEEVPPIGRILQLVVLRPSRRDLIDPMSTVATLIVERRVSTLSTHRKSQRLGELVDIGTAPLEVKALGLAIGCQRLQRIVIGLLILLGLLLLLVGALGITTREVDQGLQKLIGIVTSTIIALTQDLLPRSIETEAVVALSSRLVEA